MNLPNVPPTLLDFLLDTSCQKGEKSEEIAEIRHFNPVNSENFSGGIKKSDYCSFFGLDDGGPDASKPVVEPPAVKQNPNPPANLPDSLPPPSPCLFCGSGVVWFSRGSAVANCEGCLPMPGSRSPLIAVVESAWMLVGENDQVDAWAWSQIYPRSSWQLVVTGQAVVDGCGPLANDPNCAWCAGEECPCVCRESVDASDYFYPLISPADRVYLLSKFPKSSPNCRHREPCSWCGGRSRHNPLCVTLRDDWHSVMPWGKHKGEHLSVMARSEEGRKYLLWTVASGRATGELREDVERVLGIESKNPNLESERV